MQIDLDLLFTWGTVSKKYKKNEIIFYEGESALFYYQIISGSIKMFSVNEDGREFIQGFFASGSSFGEPPLFLDENYPSSSMALEDSIIVKITRDKFLHIIEEYPSINKNFMKLMCSRVLNKALTNKNLINQKPVCRITYFLENFRKQQNNPCKDKMQIPFTRQEIADFTGLRVETVIRTLSEMKKNNTVEIINHKLFF